MGSTSLDIRASMFAGVDKLKNIEKKDKPTDMLGKALRRVSIVAAFAGASRGLTKLGLDSASSLVNKFSHSKSPEADVSGAIQGVFTDSAKKRVVESSGPSLTSLMNLAIFLQGKVLVELLGNEDDFTFLGKLASRLVSEDTIDSLKMFSLPLQALLPLLLSAKVLEGHVKDSCKFVSKQAGRLANRVLGRENKKPEKKEETPKRASMSQHIVLNRNIKSLDDIVIANTSSHEGCNFASEILKDTVVKNDRKSLKTLSSILSKMNPFVETLGKNVLSEVQQALFSSARSILKAIKSTGHTRGREVDQKGSDLVSVAMLVQTSIAFNFVCRVATIATVLLSVDKLVLGNPILNESIKNVAQFTTLGLISNVTSMISLIATPRTTDIDTPVSHDAAGFEAAKASSERILALKGAEMTVRLSAIAGMLCLKVGVLSGSMPVLAALSAASLVSSVLSAARAGTSNTSLPQTILTAAGALGGAGMIGKNLSTFTEVGSVIGAFFTGARSESAALKEMAPRMITVEQAEKFVKSSESGEQPVEDITSEDETTSEAAVTGEAVAEGDDAASSNDINNDTKLAAKSGDGEENVVTPENKETASTTATTTTEEAKTTTTDVSEDA